MNKFEGMARAALDEQNKVRESKENAAAEAKARRDAQQKAEREYLETIVLPVLHEASVGFKNAGIEVFFKDQPPAFRQQVSLVVGHNRAGRTGNRVATLVAAVEGEQLNLDVSSANGPARKWNVKVVDGQASIEEAIADCLNRWTENGGYPRRN